MNLSVDWMTEAENIACQLKPGDVGAGDHGCFDHLHDAVLADPQAVRRGAWRIARSLRRRPGRERSLRRGRRGRCWLNGAECARCGGWCSWSPVCGWSGGFGRSRRIGWRFRHTRNARLRGLKRRWRCERYRPRCAESQSIQSVVSALRTTHRCGKEFDRHAIGADLFPGATRLWPARNAAEVEHRPSTNKGGSIIVNSAVRLEESVSVPARRKGCPTTRKGTGDDVQPLPGGSARMG